MPPLTLIKGQPRLDKLLLICSNLATAYHHPSSINMERAEKAPTLVTELLRTQICVDIYLSIFLDYISKTSTVCIIYF